MKKVLFGALILLGVIFAAHSLFSYRRYNVILITIDTLRTDYVHCYNSGAAPTPNLDRIAANGVLFTNAFTLIPITMPSHTAMLTSRQPYELGLFNNGDRFDHRVPILSDLLEDKNYTTAAFVSLGVLNKAFGLAQGFDFYDDNFENTNGRFYRVAAEINASALPWIEKQRDNRFFAWIHYSDPHEPYIAADAPPDTSILINGRPYKEITLAKKERINLTFTADPGKNVIEFHAIDNSSAVPDNQKPLSRRFIDPHVAVQGPDGGELKFGETWIDIRLRNGQQIRFFEVPRATITFNNPSARPQKVQIQFTGGVWEERVSQVRQNYAAEVRYVDKYIGQVWDRLQQLGLLDKTIIVVAADHGEGLKTHGILGHVDKLWNETMHIPFLVYYPKLGYKGRRVDALVNTLDIMPTVLDLLHIKNKKPMEGISLKRYISRSPVDHAFSSRSERAWTYGSTFSPEAAHDSFAITDGKLKVIHTPDKRGWQWEAYDLLDDPIEKKNIARFEPDRFQAMSTMKGLLEGHRKEAQAAHQQRKNPVLSPEEQQMLQNLGYVGGGEETQNP